MEEVEVDKLFAKEFGTTDEERAFLSDIMQSAREGHLCIEPTHQINAKFIENLDDETEWFERLIGKWKNRYYLQRNWVLETRVVREFKRLIKQLVKPLDLTETHGLNPMQKEACKKGLTQGLLCLTGGPGTGKTYTIARIVQEYTKQVEGPVILAAPTGKAALHLKSKVPDQQVQVSTLHSLLKIRSAEEVIWNKQKLPQCLLIIDECSMIDIALWAALLSAVQEGTRLILVGDQDQLPPVESGTVFGELCHHLEGTEHYAHLDTCMRTEQQEILNWSSAIRKGQLADYPLSQTLEVEKWAQMFPKPTRDPIDLEAIFKSLNAFRILSCVREGPWGVNTLNEKINHELRKSFRGGCTWPIPIMITKTDYELEVFNGDVALLLKKSGAPFVEKGDEVVIEGQDGLRKLPALLITNFEFAYTLSVHKSQGSEYDHVALLVPEGSQSFGRQILYTGSTRARSTLKVIAEQSVIEACILKTGEKLSGIRERLDL